MHEAATYGHMTLLRALGRMSDILHAPQRKCTPVQRAAISGQTHAVDILVELGAQFDPAGPIEIAESMRGIHCSVRSYLVDACRC